MNIFPLIVSKVEGALISIMDNRYSSHPHECSYSKISDICIRNTSEILKTEIKRISNISKVNYSIPRKGN